MSLPAKLLAIVLALAALYAGHVWDRSRAVQAAQSAAHAAGAAEVQRQWDQATATQERQRADTEAAYRRQEAGLRAAFARQETAYEAEIARLKAAAAARDADHRRVRDQLTSAATAARAAASAADATCRVERERFARAAELAAQGQRLVVEAQGLLGQLDAKVRALQAIGAVGASDRP